MKQLQKEQILKDYYAMKSVAYRYMQKKDYERALRTVFVACGYIYTFSPVYCDDELEKMVQQIGKDLGIHPQIKNVQEKNILYYDGMGNDRRGLSVIYIRALTELGYHVVYVTYKEFKETIPQIRSYLDDHSIFYIKSKNFKDQMIELYQLINCSKVQKVLLYTYPEDVVGIGVFSQYKGVLQRFLINITDHAFWMGKSALDYTIEFRSYGANISYQQRKIAKDHIFLLPFYPNIAEVEFGGLPFDSHGKKVIFSGGQLYKTYGKDNQYYKMVENILNMDSNIIFYYVGDGDRTEIDKLMNKYPNKVYCDKERNDFFQVMRECYFYLSTYPYFGGLMTQYAIAAGKLPITLASEQIIGEQTVEVSDAWYFEEINTLYREVKTLICDEKYLHSQEERIRDTIISKEEFAERLGLILSQKIKKNEIDWKGQIDTKNIQQIILERTGLKEYYGLFCRVRAPFLIWKFPRKFLIGLVANIQQHKLKIKRQRI